LIELPRMPPGDLHPLTQKNAQALFDWVYAPWIKEMGLTDIVVREGFVSMRLPLNDRLTFFSGAVCGQALMAAIDTVASMAAMTSPRVGKGTVYQHTHFLRPAANDDFLVAATVRRFGKSSAYVDCSVTFVSSGELVAHAVLEFAF
jgi:acyl-coenzyme A thioesterase PaaI-like protein